jgi:hypothetical protein
MVIVIQNYGEKVGKLEFLILGALAKSQKGTGSFILSIHMPIGMEPLGSHWMGFHEI